MFGKARCKETAVEFNAASPAGEGRGIAPDAPGAFAVEPEGEVAAAGAQDGWDETAAGAGDEGNAAGADNRLGDFDGAALHTAAVEGWQHLEHDRVGLRRYRVLCRLLRWGLIHGRAISRRCRN